MFLIYCFVDPFGAICYFSVNRIRFTETSSYVALPENAIGRMILFLLCAPDQFFFHPSVQIFFCTRSVNVGEERERAVAIKGIW